MALHILSLKLAKILDSSSFCKIDKFYELAESRELLRFTFCQFYYSYPEFGKKWKSGEICEYHRINTECCMCHKPIKKLNNGGVCNAYLKKAGRERMLIFCDRCVTNCSNLLSEWEPKNIISKQLQLF
jgi:hypothetical protein